MADPYNLGKPDLRPDMYPTLPIRDPEPTAPNLMDNKTNEKVNEKASVDTNMHEVNTKEIIDNEKEVENVEDDKKDTEKPLLNEDSVTIEIKPGNEEEDTFPLPEKKKKSVDDSDTLEKKQREKLPVYLFPFSRLKNAWNDSTNVFQFLGTAVCIIFQTVGWFTCVGGVPFLSLVMLIIGSIYVYDCKIQPNIPIYLIVSGVIGTIQHFITIWTKYVPKNAKGRLQAYRSYCKAINGLFHSFLFIWFILGCVWVYGAHSDVDTRSPEKDEYCHKILYYFAFWILNLSFMLLAMLVALSFCFIVCIIATAD